MRRNAREAVFKILFAENYNNEVGEDFIEAVFTEEKLNEKDAEFARLILSTVSENFSELAELIEKYAEGYKFDRIYPTDKCALLIAVSEMKYLNDVPLIVSIDESLSLVRKYSTEESLGFVNGVLASVKKEIESSENN